MCSKGWFKQNCFRSRCWPNVGGYPPIPLTFFWKRDFPLRGCWGALLGKPSNTMYLTEKIRQEVFDGYPTMHLIPWSYFFAVLTARRCNMILSLASTNPKIKPGQVSFWTPKCLLYVSSVCLLLAFQQGGSGQEVDRWFFPTFFEV